MAASPIDIVLPIPADHAAFAGHFPGQPIVPAVVLLDETLHAIERQEPQLRGSWRIDSAKFHSTVGPGEAVMLNYQKTANAAFRFTLHVQQRLVATGILSISA
jgi:3-hydroxymyristoyl/3-hydroxydecanoyl-(acyl carrier protein) dehydratase